MKSDTSAAKENSRVVGDTDRKNCVRSQLGLGTTGKIK